MYFFYSTIKKLLLLTILDLLAQVKFSGPKTFPPKIWELSKLRIWQPLTVLRTGRARVGKPPAGDAKLVR